MNSNFFKKVIIFCFVAVPLLSSIISMIHLVDLFYLGNPSWISYTVSVAVEIGAIASFLTLSILSKLNKGIVWSMFILLFLMQVIGNVYFSYDWITKRIAESPLWIANFKEMMEFFIFEIDDKTTKMILSLLIGVPIPLISVFLLKSTTDYLGDDTETAAPQAEMLYDKSPEPLKVVKETPIEEIPLNEEQKVEGSEIHISENLESGRNRLHPSMY